MDNYDTLMQKMNALGAHSTQISAALGARALVLGAFMDAAVPALNARQCNAVVATFRHRIEDAMAMMDNTLLPEQFHSVVLQLTNFTLSQLRKQQATAQDSQWR
ncbi:hypothetical protein [Paraburkholderia sp. ZP32-5]|uniref:hypothetical protein n=1 Tax=Paraburkholderia sp. ZP32-5 TaxID=2883245 RepID=UPI001F2A3FD1|nr:hypothetical protein [Paraburkholderia sp. ZP32-5]